MHKFVAFNDLIHSLCELCGILVWNKAMWFYHIGLLTSTIPWDEKLSSSLTICPLLFLLSIAELDRTTCLFPRKSLTFTVVIRVHSPLSVPAPGSSPLLLRFLGQMLLLLLFSLVPGRSKSGVLGAGRYFSVHRVDGLAWGFCRQFPA